MTEPHIHETGAGGKTSHRRLYVQFMAFAESIDSALAIEALEQAGTRGVLYEDVNHPRGIGLATFSEDPAYFADHGRKLLAGEPFIRMDVRHPFTMLGRTYAIGYEPDLDETLIGRPRRTLLNADWPWAIWYPLRRKDQFARLPADERRAILAEHGKIGHAFGQADLAHDVRLACHGLTAEDNDFVIGLTGAELTPLSKVVQAMRRTKQTSMWIQRMGPFFVGRKVWQSGQ